METGDKNKMIFKIIIRKKNEKMKKYIIISSFLNEGFTTYHTVS